MSNFNECLNELMEVDGAVAAALVDYTSGMMLGSAGGGINLDVAAAGNSEVIKAKQKVMGNLGLKDEIEDILITLGGQYHLIRLMSNAKNLFIYYVLDHKKANMALARHKLTQVEGKVEV